MVIRNNNNNNNNNNIWLCASGPKKIIIITITDKPKTEALSPRMAMQGVIKCTTAETTCHIPVCKINNKLGLIISSAICCDQFLNYKTLLVIEISSIKTKTK